MLCAALLVLAALPSTACDAGETAVVGLTPEAFADVIVALRLAEREALATDSAEAVYERRKREILAEYETSEAELREFVRVSARDLRMLDALWEGIADRLRQPVEPDPTATAADSETDPEPDSIQAAEAGTRPAYDVESTPAPAPDSLPSAPSPPRLRRKLAVDTT